MVASVQSNHNLSFPPLDPDYIRWTRNTINSLDIGGAWIIPRSITIVTREAETQVSIMGPESASTSILTRYVEAAGFTITIAENGPVKA